MDVQNLTLFLYQPKVLPNDFIQFELAIHMVGLTLSGDDWTGLEVATCTDERKWISRLRYHLNRLDISDEEKEAHFHRYKTKDHIDRLAKARRWLGQQLFTQATFAIAIDQDGKERELARHVWATGRTPVMLETGLFTYRTEHGQVHTACMMVHVPSLLAVLGQSATPSEEKGVREPNLNNENTITVGRERDGSKRAKKIDIADWFHKKEVDWRGAPPAMKSAWKLFERETGQAITRDAFDIAFRNRYPNLAPGPRKIDCPE